MKLVRTLALGGAIGSSVALVGASHASTPQCTCVVRPGVVGPFRQNDAPTSSRVLVRTMQMQGGPLPTFVLRTSSATGPGADVPVTRTTTVDLARLDAFVELVPAAPLAPRTRYEIALVDPKERPAIRVFGTFQTGELPDVVPPVIQQAGRAVPHKTPGPRSSCSLEEPRVHLDGFVAIDPGRAEPDLRLLVWRSDPRTGRLDAQRAPDAIGPVPSRRSGGTPVVGGTSLCYPIPLPMDETGAFSLGVVVADESGNRSPLQRYAVDMTGASP